MNTKQAIHNLMTAAKHSDDPAKIRQYAHDLERISAWQEARDVERMADEAERRYAENAMMKR